MASDSPGIAPTFAEPTGDRFGGALAAGDFDGNGRADLAAGASLENVVMSDDDAGAVNVLNGGAAALTVVDDQFWH